MKKLVCISSFVCLGICGFSQAEAAVTHLDVDFSDYTPGMVEGQSEGAGGSWIGASAWYGEVVPVAGYNSGTQALEVYKTAGSTAGRGSVPMMSRLSLTSAGKIYMSIDVFSKASDGNFELVLSNGSAGNVTKQGFGIYFNKTRKPIKFHSSTVGGTPVRIRSSLSPDKDTWYRFEFEITQSATPGVGTFSVFASTQNSARIAVITDENYSFTMTTFPTLNVIPLVPGEETNAVAFNHLVLQSGLEDFPVNPMSTPEQ